MTRLFVNRLTVIDFSYLDPHRGLLGESWLVDIELEGGLDAQGMVLDFAEVKRQVKQSLDQHFDHKLLVPNANPGLKLTQQGEMLELRFTLDNGRFIHHRSPTDAICLIDAPRIDSEAVTQAIEATLTPLMPTNVKRLGIHLYPEPCDGACYQYSHGLQQHAGNCQRIAHGHRSPIQILRNGQRDATLEREWAARWRDIFICSRSYIQGENVEDGVRYLQIAYQAAQGPFKLQLPASCCYLIDTDSTVENLAQHIAETLKAEHPSEHFLVRAYEGVGKGALGEA
ncbi:6-carboxytetrahydropterin synthase [endosymbiont of Ridgeia piscesae]|jgi:6-pyruvoyl-tetrahydropterin synthase|uniref:6-carboxy-5,6,7,8-tetrahydropterin synthase n=1 Tax=endosymbiont of Ridgeia piscesae TaxID=54398 RepID=A0A0T5YTL0_9GAMM|nr:6-carboxytetrahydropterin synthase [endosymbiont of Ridgeia piscesae]KRT53782.1 6-pyruvoyl tetrahydropterin synthase [endosymbiont of Ridgeia piscesae]KRT59484.1 6-pyruvoyl tetrahydropterin synthase [endosymbiont of Ridgeia piscesae]